MSEQQQPSVQPAIQVEPPRLPSGYIQMAEEVIPLLSHDDGRWIARVLETSSLQQGMLIFEDQHKIVFVSAEESATVLDALLAHHWHLLPYRSNEYNQTHADRLGRLGLAVHAYGAAPSALWRSTLPGEGGSEA